MKTAGGTTTSLPSLVVKGIFGFEFDVGLYELQEKQS